MDDIYRTYNFLLLDVTVLNTSEINKSTKEIKQKRSNIPIQTVEEKLV